MKYSADILREKRNIKEAKLFCDKIFSSVPIEEFESFILKKGGNRFFKVFWDEYYPLSLYSNLKYADEDYIIFLCEIGSKIDAKIIDEKNNGIETIQITTASFDYNNALKNEKLLKDGFSLGVGNFKRNRNGSISQSRGMRSEETALNEESSQIIRAIDKKLKKNIFKNIDVLLVATESRFNKVIKDYYKKLTRRLWIQLKNKGEIQQGKFKEIYLIDFSNVLVKL